jgi:hypothetical protein
LAGVRIVESAGGAVPVHEIARRQSGPRLQLDHLDVARLRCCEARVRIPGEAGQESPRRPLTAQHRKRLVRGGDRRRDCVRRRGGLGEALGAQQGHEGLDGGSSSSALTSATL